MSNNSHEIEVKSGKRFEFGKNWSNFLKTLNEKRIKDAEESLKNMLSLDNLEGKTFLDIGSGSGLFSLAARRLGAKVFSFDYDPFSVSCTKELKNRYYKNDLNWTVEEGSVLDKEYLKQLNQFDIVYSWGVLHHTGSMWEALNNVCQNVKKDGLLFIALYNHQQFATTYWKAIKKCYVKFKILRPLIFAIHLIYPILPLIIYHKVSGKTYERGMTYIYDLFDWLGGYPFETSTPEQVFKYYKEKGFNLENLITVGGKLGCNEFVFKKSRIIKT